MRHAAVPVAVALAAAAPAGAGAQSAAEVQARGNPFAGDLRFAPAQVTVAVGGLVGWTNTDALVPHTATEKHGLWDLAGTYGGTPSNPPGFAPRERVSRVFEAGTHEYLCRVHPTMTGTVAAPVGLTAARRRVSRTRRVRLRVPGRRRPVYVRVRVTRTVGDVTMRWAATPAGATPVFDVEVQRGAGPYVRFATGTRQPAGTLVGQPLGTVFNVRARLRDRGDPARSTGWSPVATIVV